MVRSTLGEVHSLTVHWHTVIQRLRRTNVYIRSICSSYRVGSVSGVNSDVIQIRRSGGRCSSCGSDRATRSACIACAACRGTAGIKASGSRVLTKGGFDSWMQRHLRQSFQRGFEAFEQRSVLVLLDAELALQKNEKICF